MTCINYYKPITLIEYYIYDILHNDNNELILISAAEIVPPLKIQLFDDNKYIDFLIEICPHKHVYIYILPCNIYNKEIIIVINDKKFNVNVNKYPSFPNEIIMSTLTKNDDNYIIQWINYHMIIGVTRFIIYDNSLQNTLNNILEKYIKDGTVILINWQYQYTYKLSGHSGQQSQQNHSIYTFRSSKYIGLMDFDEYVNLQKNYYKIDLLFNDIISKENLDVTKYSGFRLLNRFFYNPNNSPTNGYEFLKIYNCDIIYKQGREKLFVIPKNLQTFSVHTVTKGKKMFIVNESLAYFNHYCFLNKKNRGRNKTELQDFTIKKIADLIDNPLLYT